MYSRKGMGALLRPRPLLAVPNLPAVAGRARGDWLLDGDDCGRRACTSVFSNSCCSFSACSPSLTCMPKSGLRGFATLSAAIFCDSAPLRREAPTEDMAAATSSLHEKWHEQHRTGSMFFNPANVNAQNRMQHYLPFLFARARA